MNADSYKQKPINRISILMFFLDEVKICRQSIEIIVYLYSRTEKKMFLVEF
jgi:hypothetical protein